MGLTIGMAASYGVDGITMLFAPDFSRQMTEDTLFNEEFMRMYNFTDPMERRSPGAN